MPLEGSRHIQIGATGRNTDREYHHRSDLAIRIALGEDRVWDRQRIAKISCVMTYLYGGFKLQENRLGNKNLSRLGAKITDFRFKQLYLLSRPAAANF